MSQFRQIDSHFLASPQITLDDVAAAQALGVKLIVNNRPEGDPTTRRPALPSRPPPMPQGSPMSPFP
jgi:uncharacterized protein (TIGR01244 family)